MLKFIFRRCLEAIPTLFILITISFFMMRLAPGSPFTGERTLPPEVMANIEAKYHLNDPIMTQYFNYLKQLAHGDFGPSFKYKDYSVNDLVASSFPVSAKLGLAAFLLAVVLGVTAGVIAALKQNTKWDYAVMGVAMTGVVIPSFVVAPLLVMIFAITLHWLPGGGWNGGNGGWNNGGGDGDWNGGGGRPPGGGYRGDVLLFEDAGYQGRVYEVVGDIPDLSVVNFNDKASSIKIQRGKWEICEHANYQGRCSRLDADQVVLPREWNDQITSIRRVK